MPGDLEKGVRLAPIHWPTSKSFLELILLLWGPKSLKYKQANFSSRKANELIRWGKLNTNNYWIHYENCLIINLNFKHFKNFANTPMANQNANMLPENLRTCGNQASWPHLMLFFLNHANFSSVSYCICLFDYDSNGLSYLPTKENGLPVSVNEKKNNA